MNSERAPRYNAGATEQSMLVIPTPGRRPELGALFRQLREGAGVSREQAAATLGCTSSKIGDLELARSSPKLAEAEKLLEKYQVPQEQRARILAHVRLQIGRKRYDTCGDYVPPRRLRRIVELESQAVAASYYSGDVIPPLLQVRSYAEALSTSIEPTTRGAANLAEFQLTRQHLLHRRGTRPPLRYRCYLGEAVLHIKTGSEAIMREQLAHLRDLALNLPNFELHLVPFDVGSHPLLGISATLYFFPRPAPPQLISEVACYSFARRHGTPTQDPSEAFDLLAQTALSRSDTVHRLATKLGSAPSAHRSLRA